MHRLSAPRSPRLLVLAALPALALACTQGGAPDQHKPAAVDKQPAKEVVRFTYPETRQGDVVDDYHGTKVADPYRWLEEPDSPETRAWVDAQNKVTFGLLESIPEREAIRARLTELWNYERYGLPHREGDSYFFSKNDGLQDQSVIYVTPSLDAAPRVFLDPNKLSADGTVALGSIEASHDGKLVAYGLQSAGSDWEEFHVRDVATGEDLPDLIKWSKFSEVSWTADNKGFFYARYDAPKEGEEYAGANYNHKIYYHRLGTDQSADPLIYKRDDHPRWGFGSRVTEDGRYLVTKVWEGTDKKNGVFYRDLSKGPEAGAFVELLNKFDAEYGFIGNVGSVFYFRTDLDAPRGRVIAIDTKRPDPANWTTIIPEAPETLRSVSDVGGKLVAAYLQDAHTLVRVHGADGKLEREVALPGIGSAFGFGGKQSSPETFYVFTGFTTPGTVYRYDVSTGESSEFAKPTLAFNPDDYETEQVFYNSKDGTRIPMFITGRKGAARDKSTPTYLYGYGGFNIAITPSFSVANLAWMEMGGLLAVANLRGGGEYGREWHDAGRKLNKQNV
ncbi:MAG: prolyl oligopeptidase family serine peptidase, partial [Myxococcales bacterium]|nr:prolyl oligopeptidase family serine peptidase [Myxococcales bacterium]